jgi:sortase (surface protein transpeptidase)
MPSADRAPVLDEPAAVLDEPAAVLDGPAAVLDGPASVLAGRALGRVAPETELAPAALSRSVPTRLDIPAIGVHTGLIALGLNPDGTIEVPPLSGGAPAGWYRHSVTPGERGAAVLVGHLDSARDGAAVFYRLGALKPGDGMAITRADGSVVRFVVTRAGVYPKDAFPTAQVYGPADAPELRLITCGGSFDRRRGSYRDNVIVWAGRTA